MAISECLNGTMDGLLTGGTLQPRSVWWAHQLYGAGTATRVRSTTSNNAVVALASRSSGAGLPQVLVGHVDFVRTTNRQPGILAVQLALNGITALPRFSGATQVEVRLELVHDSGEAALTGPAPVSTFLLPVSGGIARLALPLLSVGDVFRLTVHLDDTSSDDDGDGLPERVGSSIRARSRVATDENGASGDPDGDGRTNAQELAAGTHPRGLLPAVSRGRRTERVLRHAARAAERRQRDRPSSRCGSSSPAASPRPWWRRCRRCVAAPSRALSSRRVSASPTSRPSSNPTSRSSSIGR